MKKEQRIDFNELNDPKTITKKNRLIWKQMGLDLQRDECDIVDDPDLQQRIYQVQTRRTFVCMGG